MFVCSVPPLVSLETLKCSSYNYYDKIKLVETAVALSAVHDEEMYLKLEKEDMACA